MKYSASSVWENKDRYGIAVIGAGHAGCEAALAAARDVYKRQICDWIFSCIDSSVILIMIGFLSPSFTRSVARSIQLNSSFLLIRTFVS